MLLVVSKVMGKTVIERIRSGVDSKLSNEQAGFKRGKGTTDTCTNARDCTSFYFYFVDVEKAFESVHRDGLWLIMKSYSITKMINMVKAQTYNDLI